MRPSPQDLSIAANRGTLESMDVVEMAAPEDPGLDEATDLLRISEAAALLGVHRDTLLRWADAGKVPHLKTLGGHRRFRRSAIAALAGQLAKAA